MPIQKLNFKVSVELEKELEFFQSSPFIENLYSNIQKENNFSNWIESNPDYTDLKIIKAELPRGRVLDIGVGPGLSTAYLALQGFEMSCLEPSIYSCQQMEKFFNRLGVHSDIICGTAETMDQIGKKFDSVVYYSSLHHCDDPVLALKNTARLLVPGGKVVLFEPVLRFYRSRDWFYRMMKEHPEKVGHYGGNEHIYRYREYLNFLKVAGFKNPVVYPSVKYLITPKRATWDSNARWLIKKQFYRLMARVSVRPNILRTALMKMSLIAPLIIAEKA